MAVSNIKWRPEWTETIVELGKQGSSLKSMYAALGISDHTGRKLRKDDPAAEEAFSLARTFSQSYWENLMLINVENKSFNSRVAEIALRGLFPEDYKDTRDTKVDVKVDAKIDFGKEVQDLIKALNEAK